MPGVAGQACSIMGRDCQRKGPGMWAPSRAGAECRVPGAEGVRETEVQCLHWRRLPCTNGQQVWA